VAPGIRPVAIGAAGLPVEEAGGRDGVRIELAGATFRRRLTAFGAPL